MFSESPAGGSLSTGRASLLLGIVIALAPVTVVPLHQEAESGLALSLRNTTRQLMTFRVKPFDSSREGPEQVIAPGSIARFPGPFALDLTFESGGRRLEYRMDPGVDYAFRYDDDENVDLFLGSHDREDVPDLAPYVTTPMSVVERMLELASVDEDDVVFDLGCGDGRIVIEAAKRGARGVGVDLDPRRIEESKRLAEKAGVEPLVEFRVEDATTTDFSAATVLTLYLLPESNELLRPIMEERLADGARVLSHNYEVPGWSPAVEETLVDDSGAEHLLFAYVIGHHEPKAE